MKKYLLLPFLVLAFSFTLLAQSKSNEAIEKQIKTLNAENIVLTYDASSEMSKIMATGADFGREEAKRLGVEAMNFGMAFFYPGKALASAPEEINFTFWVLTKKPRFAAAHAWTATLAGGETLDLGDARYVSKPKENMEYLNFKISRVNLEKIVADGKGKFKLGVAELQFTPEHLKTFANLLKIVSNE